MRILSKTQEGQIFRCLRCSLLRMNRHKVASINIGKRQIEGVRGGRRGKPE